MKANSGIVSTKIRNVIETIKGLINIRTNIVSPIRWINKVACYNICGITDISCTAEVID